ARGGFRPWTTGVGRERRARADRDPRVDWPTMRAPRPLPPRRARRAAAAARVSRALSAVHPLLVRQLAPVLDQVARAPLALGRLLRDHLDGERLEALVAPGRQDRVLV